MQNIKLSIVIVLLATILGLFLVYPNFTNSNKNKINLGLDLQGGAQLLLNIKFDSYLNDQLEMLAGRLKNELKEHKIQYRNFKITDKKIRFQVLKDDREGISRVLDHMRNEMVINKDRQEYELYYSDYAIEMLRRRVMEQSIEIIRMRIDETGTREPAIYSQNQENIVLEVPGISDPAYLKEALGKTAKLSLHLVEDSVNAENASKGMLPVGTMLVKRDDGGYSVVKKKPVITGDMLNDARVGFGQLGQPIVEFSLNTTGAKLFGDFTKNYVGRRLAIILDNKLLSDPTINEPILGGRGSIAGNFTIQSASNLALFLRAGALPAPLEIVEERSIGPSLGLDSIASGKISAAIGFLGVIIFMIWTYGILGIFATIALIVNMIYIIALLSLFEATLTLPGIAGIILTMGMAVDANVLIYERIREDIESGASILYSVRNGFQSAFSAIADSNITTLISGLLLYNFGTGTIKGFAVTLSIGIITSMFSAIFITKVLIELWILVIKPKTLGI